MAGTIAVVDDDQDVREFLGMQSDTAGHTVRIRRAILPSFRLRDRRLEAS